MKLKIYSFLLALAFIISCSKKDEPVPDPTLSVSSLNVDLGSIDIATKPKLVLTKNGTGDISYTVSSETGSWLSLNKTSGTMTSSTDSLNLTVLIPLLKVGANTTTITITPTINSKVSAPITVTIKGNYQTPSLTANPAEINLGTLSATSKGSFVLKIGGKANYSYLASSNKTWLVLDKTSGAGSTDETFNFTINPNDLDDGDNTAIVTITPTINGQMAEPVKVTVNGTFAKITNIVGDLTINKNTTWSGIVNISGNVTVDKAALFINPGTIVNITKNTASPYNLIIRSNAVLVINGTQNKIVQFKSSLPVTARSTYDWAGIYVFGNVQASYCAIMNAGTAFNIDQFSDDKRNPSIDNCLFQNNLDAIDYYGTNNVNIGYITTKNSGTPILGGGTKPTLAIYYCDFIDTPSYIHDIKVYTNNGKYIINSCNFETRQYDFLNHIYFANGTNWVNNSVEVNKCFSLTKVGGDGAGINGNTFTQTSPNSTKLTGIGCGFLSNFIINATPKLTKSQYEALREKHKVQSTRIKALQE